MFESFFGILIAALSVSSLMLSIQSMEIPTESSLTADMNLENLKLFIGEERYNELFGENGELNSFNSLNSIIEINGQNMSVNYLIELITKLNSGEVNIIEVYVE